MCVSIYVYGHVYAYVTFTYFMAFHRLETSYDQKILRDKKHTPTLSHTRHRKHTQRTHRHGKHTKRTHAEDTHFFSTLY